MNANGDPVLAWSSDGTKVYFIHQEADNAGNLAITSAVSTDGGATWKTGVVAAPDAAGFNDKPWIDVGPNHTLGGPEIVYATWHDANSIKTAARRSLRSD